MRVAEQRQAIRSRHLQPATCADLIATEEGIRKLLESAPDPVVITDGAGLIVLVNRQAELTFGYAREELIGQCVDVLLPEQLRELHVGHRRIYCHAPRTRPMGMGLRLVARRRDGSELPVEISLSPLRLRGQQFVISTVRDVTERRSLEREEDNLLASLTSTLEGVTEAVFAFDSQGRLVRANPAASRLLGRPADQLRGLHIRDVFRFEDQAGRALETDEYAFQKTLAGTELVSVRDRFLPRPEGGHVVVSVSSALVRDRERDVDLVVQLVRDVDDERQVEELKNQVISLVSHELRTPIANIKGFSSSLLQEGIEFDAATWRDFVSEIDHEVDRLGALVQDLLDMSKIEAGTIVLNAQPVSPAEITTEVLRGVGKIAAKHELVSTVVDALPRVMVDVSQVERVLGNLIENAVKYSPPGTRIEIGAATIDASVAWSVRDHGPGVPLEYRERIFEKFVRAPVAGTRIPGTGLGLPICKGIVEAHGGRLWLESTEGGGSRFVFTVPVAS